MLIFRAPLQFKIEESGLLSGSLANGQWAQGQLIADNSSWTTTIPASLKAGEYLLRHELLAIHSSNQPQFYPECAQLKVTVSILREFPERRSQYELPW